jgi:hypothetical protein
MVVEEEEEEERVRLAGQVGGGRERRDPGRLR